MSEKQEIFWLSEIPNRCDLCKCAITHKFYDAHLKIGCAANVCPSCFLFEGIGLGIGRGQEYTKQKNGSYKQTAGGSGKY